MTIKAQSVSYSATELEDYLVGDLDPERTAAIERAAEADAHLAAYLADRRADRDAFHFDPNRRTFTSLVEESGVNDTPGMFESWWLRVALGLAALTAAALVFAPRDIDPAIRTKGGLSVKAAVLDGATPRMLDTAVALNPGNRLRLTVEDPAGGFLTVLLEEASGEVEVLYRPDELGDLKPGAHLLPGSLELDAVLGRERLYVIMSNDRPDPAAWIAEIKRSQQRAGFDHGWLPPRGTRVRTIEYDKVEP